MKGNSNEIRDRKIQFLRDSYPQIEKIDFVLNQVAFIDAKRKLFEAGFYKIKFLSELNDSAVFNLLMLAQGKKTFKKRSIKIKQERLFR